MNSTWTLETAGGRPQVMYVAEGPCICLWWVTDLGPSLMGFGGPLSLPQAGPPKELGSMTGTAHSSHIRSNLILLFAKGDPGPEPIATCCFGPEITPQKW